MNENIFQVQTIDAISRFVDKDPELVLEWQDNYSDAVGYLVINSLKNGAAGGGTRVHENISVQEVRALAKTMEIKFAISGPNIGGAKTGIRTASNDPDKYAILKRWFTAIRPMLKYCYGTGSDLNTDIHKINSILKDLGIQHAQEGIINTVSAKTLNHNYASIEKKMSLLSSGVVITKDYKVKLSELVTGFGVAQSIYHLANETGVNLTGKRVFIQGVGNVGAAAAYFLNKHKAKIVAVSDKEGAFISDKGLSQDELVKLLLHRKIRGVLDNTISHWELQNWLKNEKIDIFIPAAGSQLIECKFVKSLMQNELEMIACGANNPFIENSLCYGSCSQYIDREIMLIPDFIANCGMARAFYRTMSAESVLSVDDIFNDISNIIKNAIQKCIQLKGGRLLAASAYHLAMNNQMINH